LPQPIVFIAACALVFLAMWWFPRRRPLENAWFWALLACMLGLRSALTPGYVTYYFATGALVLVFALVDTSYLLAYRDELTGLPGRRAFNEVTGELRDPYTLAMVDVDHFKNF